MSKSALDELEPLGFDQEAFDVLQTGLNIEKLGEDVFHERVEVRLRVLLRLYKAHGFGVAKDWNGLALIIVLADPVLLH